MENEEKGSFDFDKFMDDIVVREQKNRPAEPGPADQTTPQREYIKRYRELPQNRTRWSR